MNINNIINDMDLSSGENKRTNCPSCGGRNTFNVTNDRGTMLWHCYKANCKLTGKKVVSLTAQDIRSSMAGKDKKKSGPFVKPEWLVYDNNAIHAYCNTWDLDPDELGLLYDVKENRVVFPVIHDGVMVDATGRTLRKRLPKWKRYGKSDLPYSYGRGTVAVVVEDCVSAAIVGGDVYVGVAVLGTSLSEAHKKYLTRFSTAIVALDPDALPKTLKFARELRQYVNKVRALKLHDDLKYRNPSDILNLITLGV